VAGGGRSVAARHVAPRAKGTASKKRGDQETHRVCAECGRKPLPNENAVDDWRAYAGVNDDPPVFCPECAAVEFGG